MDGLEAGLAHVGCNKEVSAVPETSWRLVPMHDARLGEVMDIEKRAYAFPWTEGNFRDCLRSGYSGWLVCRQDSTIVAYAVMSMAVGEAHVLNLAVDPQLRRSGLGRYLLEHLLDTARTALSTIVLLEVRRSNKAALGLYREYGFQRIGVRKNYYPGLEQQEDAFVLALDL